MASSLLNGYRGGVNTSVYTRAKNISPAGEWFKYVKMH